MKTLFAALLLSISPTIAWTAQYTANQNNSSITFKGVHAGNEFTGTFNTWNALIDFDPKNLDSSNVAVEITMNSYILEGSDYGKTLLSADWFNVDEFLKTEFKTTSITQVSKDTYKAQGNLTLRGISKPIEFEFVLPEDQLSGETAETTFTFDLNRLNFDVGKKSDAEGEWISSNISVTVKLKAVKVASAAS